TSPLHYLSLLLSLTTLSVFFFLSIILQPPISTLFPYTTLFRSSWKLSYRRRDGVRPFVAPAGQARGPAPGAAAGADDQNVVRLRSEEHTSELQSRFDLVCRLLLEKKNKKTQYLIASR